MAAKNSVRASGNAPAGANGSGLDLRIGRRAVSAPRGPVGGSAAGGSEIVIDPFDDPLLDTIAPPVEAFNPRIHRTLAQGAVRWRSTEEAAELRFRRAKWVPVRVWHEKEGKIITVFRQPEGANVSALRESPSGDGAAQRADPRGVRKSKVQRGIK